MQDFQYPDPNREYKILILTPDNKLVSDSVGLTVAEFNRLRKLFAENVWLLIKNTECILKDGRMANTLVPVSNSVLSEFRMEYVRLGVYLQWWRDCPRESHDKCGRPIWRILGNSEENLNFCSSMSENGERVDSCELGCSLKETWQSLKNIDVRYEGGDNEMTPYRLDEVIDVLKKGG